MARPKDLSLEHTWRLRLRRQATSGLSISAFCAREGVCSASFYAWRRRLAAPQAVVRPAPPLFVPLQFDPAPRLDATTPSHGFEIELPHHVRLRCNAAPEPEWLGRLVAALAGLAPQEVSR
jgi:transposase-like protein